MKATSIEQIREHLARGGRVTVNSPQWNTHRVVERVAGESSKGPFSSVVWFTTGGAIYFDKRFDWELLPIEEPATTNAVERDLVDGMRDFVRDLKEHGLPGIDSRTLPILTEDPTGESRRKTPQIVIDGEDTGAGERIRQSLLFGHYPSLDDMRDWWQATTGERIEWGRRCNACECSGKARKHVGNGQSAMVNCKLCNGDGYTERPTWMEDQCQPQ